ALNEQAAQAKQRIRQLEGEASAQVDPEAVADELMCKFMGFGSWSIERQKAALQEYVSKIVFDGNGTLQFQVKIGMPVPDVARRAFLESTLSTRGIGPDEAVEKLANSPVWNDLTPGKFTTHC